MLKTLQMCKLNRSALLALQNHGLVDGVSKLANQLSVCIVARHFPFTLVVMFGCGLGNNSEKKKLK